MYVFWFQSCQPKLGKSKGVAISRLFYFVIFLQYLVYIILPIIVSSAGKESTTWLGWENSWSSPCSLMSVDLDQTHDSLSNSAYINKVNLFKIQLLSPYCQ